MRCKPSLSIIVPTLNEVENVAQLVTRIDSALIGKTVYEIIFIDDHSTDGTVDAIKTLMSKHQDQSRLITVHPKLGKPGKAYSLLEGFEKARFDLVCIIDADLQYPPEAIPKMLAALHEDKKDIIVADRKDIDTNLLRRLLSRTGRKLYGKWLYGLDCDVQSGLKLFRKATLSHMVLNSTSWTFDLSFLVQARENGHEIGSVPITFAKRCAGSSKVNIFRVGPEIVFEAIKFKLGKRKLLTYIDSLNTNEELA
jgi:dolichol-phosphate mannosyltransferase